MGHQLYIWEGTRPGTDSAGAAELLALARRYLLGGRVPATTAIQEFANAVAEHWSGDSRPAWWDEDWMTLRSVVAGASGPVLPLDLPMPRASIASCIVAAMAEEHGLVCWDPQVAMLRPVSEAVGDACMQRFADRLGRQPTGAEILFTMGIATDRFDEEDATTAGRASNAPYTPVRRPTASRRRRPR